MKNEGKSLNIDIEIMPGTAEDDSQPSLGTGRRKRSDRKQLRASQHDVLSRFPLEALAKAGENVRKLRRIERALRQELQPSGTFEEIAFDRAMPCYWRCLLVARVEEMLFKRKTDQRRAL